MQKEVTAVPYESWLKHKKSGWNGSLTLSLDSTSLGLRHLFGKRNYSLARRCGAMVGSESPAEAMTDISVVLKSARPTAWFLWFCGEGIGEAAGPIPAVIPFRRLFCRDSPEGRTGACDNFQLQVFNHESQETAQSEK